MRFNSSIYLSLILLALCYVLFRDNIDASYIFFSIALLENSLSLRYYPISRRVPDQKDFRFSYAEVASKIYYPISLIISYFIYIFIINYYKTSDFKLIFFLVILSLFTIFRVAINEILDYLDNTNPIKNKNLAELRAIKDSTTKKNNNILDQIKLFKNCALRSQERILLDDIYNFIKYSSREIDPSILNDIQELNQIISGNRSDNQTIESKLKEINDKL